MHGCHVSASRNESRNELNTLDDTSGDINPYKELIVINAEKADTILTQMGQWSILKTWITMCNMTDIQRIFIIVNNMVTHGFYYGLEMGKKTVVQPIGKQWLHVQKSFRMVAK